MRGLGSMLHPILEVWRGDEMSHNHASGIYMNLEENEETQLLVLLVRTIHTPMVPEVFQCGWERKRQVIIVS
jgi:hypothetical protein